METLALISLIGAAGYYLQDKTPRTAEVTKNTVQMSESEKPNSLNIYHADKVNAANDEVLKRSLNNYKDAENPAFTGVLPPIYNSYSSIGNDTILTVNVKQPSAKEMANIDDSKRRENVLKQTQSSVQDRPMFKSLNLDTQFQQHVFSDFGNDKLVNQNISLLTGQPIERDHNNMVPFFGGSITQNVETFTNESKMDNLTGNRSTFFHKSEQSARFDQVKQDIYGTPIVTEHIDTTRFIPSSFRQGEKPFYEERVAAPISGTVYNPVNDNYNPTIDQLRVATKPQISYEGRLKAGQMGNVRGVPGTTLKNRPDTSFTLGHERLFTSVGAITAPLAKQNYENMPATSRQDQNIEYYGNVMNKDALATSQRLKNIDNTDELDFSSLVQPAKRNQFHSDTQRNLGTMVPGVNDYGKNSYNLPELERESTNQMHSINLNKNTAGVRVALQDKARGTLKETMVDKKDNSGNIRTNAVNGVKNTGYTDYEAKQTQKQTLIHNKYNGHINKKDGMGYNIAKYDAKTTNKEITSNIHYSGHANDANKNAMVRNAFENAEITQKKEILLKGQRPSGPKSSLGSINAGSGIVGETKLTANMLLKEKEKSRIENINNANMIISKEHVGNSKPIYNKFSEVENNRINSAIVSSQLKDNPFYNLR